MRDQLLDENSAFRTTHGHVLLRRDAMLDHRHIFAIEFAGRCRDIPKVVFSSKSRDVDWNTWLIDQYAVCHSSCWLNRSYFSGAASEDRP